MGFAFFEAAHTNQDEKIVCWIIGTGEEFHVQAQNEDGTTILPIWGPKYHGGQLGTSWHRMGTGFNFPELGCLKITVTRGVTTGEISLDVLDPQ